MVRMLVGHLTMFPLMTPFFCCCCCWWWFPDHGFTGAAEDYTDDMDVVVLLSEKLTLENELSEVRAIDASRKQAFDELEAQIVALARQSTMMKHGSGQPLAHTL